MRVLVIGLGRMGTLHAQTLHAEGHMVGTVDTAGHGHYQTLREAGKTWDAAIIATPIDQLADTAIEAIDHGLHLLIEKPGAHDAHTMRQVHRHAEQNGRIIQVGYLERFNPALHAALMCPELGQITATSSMRFGPTPPGVDPAVDLAVHDLDLANWMSTDTHTIAYGHDPHRKVRSWLITHEHGQLEIDLRARTATAWQHGQAFQLHVEDRDALTDQWTAFQAALDDGVSAVPAIDAAAVLDQVEELHRTQVAA